MELTKTIVEEALNDIFNRPTEKRLKVYTGVYGYDMYLEKVENYSGYVRLYIGRKVSRIVRLHSKAIIKKSVLGKYYKLLRINSYGNNEHNPESR
jgi:hypothetical protein